MDWQELPHITFGFVCVKDALIPIAQIINTMEAGVFLCVKGGVNLKTFWKIWVKNLQG